MSKSISDIWKTLKSEPLVKSTLFSIRKDEIRNLSTNKTFEVTVMESLDSVNVIAITKKREIVFARQYRFGIGEETLELPGGMLDYGEDPVEAGLRELKEETGFIASNGVYLGKTAAHPVFMNAYIHHVLVDDIEQSGQTHFDDGEFIQVEYIKTEDIPKLLKDGVFNHPHTISALTRLEWI